MTDKVDIKPKNQLNNYQFYFETPLYKKVKEDDLAENILKGEVDAFSYKYKSPTTYKIGRSSIYGLNSYPLSGYCFITLTNMRKSDDIIRFILLDEDDYYEKIGQNPSLATIQQAGIDDKYSHYINGKDLTLFKKAIGLAAHGVGAGSFVYLRRIFEKQIKDAFEKNVVNLDVNEEGFSRLKMTEKVDKLAPFLPTQLTEMKSIYSILSLGVHEMTEDDCLTYFEPLKLSIELIMDQIVEQKIKEERDQKVKLEISKIHQALGRKTK